MQGAPVGKIRAMIVTPAFGTGVLLKRDQVYYRGQYVGWADYGVASPIVFDREVAPVIVEEIQLACMRRDRAYGIPPLHRNVFFTATSGHYVRRNKR